MAENRFSHKRGTDLELLFVFTEDVSAATLSGAIEAEGAEIQITDLTIVDPDDYGVEPVTQVASYSVVKAALDWTQTEDWIVGALYAADVRAEFASGRTSKSQTAYVKIISEVSQ